MDWQPPTELARSASRRSHRDRHRDARRRPAGRSRFVLAVARRPPLRDQHRASSGRRDRSCIFSDAASGQRELRSRERRALAASDHIAAGVKFTTLNGLYDWGWIGADLGVAMPPSDQLDELGALAVTIDENHRSYSLDAICARLGLPGKDETRFARSGDRGRPGAEAQEEVRLPAVHLAIAGALRRPLRRAATRSRRCRHSRRSTRSSPRRAPSTPTGSTST